MAQEIRRGIRLGDLLVREGVISEAQLGQLLERQRRSGKLLGRLLVESGVLDEEQLLNYLSISQGVPKVDLTEPGSVDHTVVTMIPERIAKRFGVVCIGKRGNVVTIAMSNPSDVVAIDNVKIATGMEVRPVLALRQQIDAAIQDGYRAALSLEQMAKDMEHEGVEAVRAEDQFALEPTAEDEADNAPVVRYVNSILYEAAKSRASDIHVEPFENDVRMRFRIDGALREVTAPPRRMFNAVVSRIKIISNLDIAERRLPQDGRCKLRIGDKDIDIRVSTLPCVYGEKVVMRLLDKSATNMELESLGMDPPTLREMKRVLAYPHGMIVMCGPTGSGKTTTLYSFLKHIYSPEVNIVTVEDPVEYMLHGVNQVQVHSSIGMTFASALRSILRQDPDVVMIGEMRDQETLEVAARAALTGHLVFSTIHTNAAVSTVTRMVDMGLEPFLVASALVSAISQRLIRRVCQKCKKPMQVSSELASQIEARFGMAPDFPLYKGEGCAECNGAGYRGRAAVYEYMSVDERLRQMIIDRDNEEQLRQYCISKRMRTLEQSAFMRLHDGITTVEEVMGLFYER